MGNVMELLTTTRQPKQHAVSLMLQSLATSKREASLEGRLRAIIDTLTSDVYNYTCLGLFERHKLMFSFQMAIKILEAGPTPVDAQVRLGLPAVMLLVLTAGDWTKCTSARWQSTLSCTRQQNLCAC